MPFRCGLMLSWLPLVCVLFLVTSTRCETAPSTETGGTIVQLSSTTLTLDEQLLGDTSLPTPILVSNIGNEVLHVTSTKIEGPAFLKDSQCSDPVQPGGACIIFIRFRPISPGTASGVLTINDNAAGSPQLVTLQGEGVTTHPVPTVSSITPNMILEGSGSQTIQAYGTGFFQSSVMRVNGENLTTTFLSQSSLTAILPSNDLGSLGELAVDVFTPAPGGGLSNSVTIVPYQVYPLSANSLIYEPFSRRLYASVSSSASTNANTILSIDPVTQKVGEPVAIGNGPNALAVSENGEFLYVGLDVDHAVQQFNTISGMLGSRTGLPTDPQNNPLNASAIQVVPNQPKTYVVSLGPPYASLAEGVSLISNGKLTSTVLSSFTKYIDLSSLGFLSSPSTFYGTDGATVWQIDISKEALSIASNVPAPLEFSQFVSDGKDLFFSNGLEYDPISNQIVGTYQLQSPAAYTQGVFPDTAIGRTYFVTLPISNLAAFSQATFGPAGSLLLPSNINSPSQLVRWGQDGFAFLNFNYSTEASDVIVLRSSLALPSPGPNGSPTIRSVVPASAHASAAANFKLTVHGSGFVPGAAVQWKGSNRTTIFVNSETLVADIAESDISTAGQDQVVVSNPTPGGGDSNPVQFTVD
jgi:trimeric autotransporter adhesin